LGANGDERVAEAQTQREYWSGRVGDAWAAYADRMDAMLAPLTEAALAAGAFQAGQRVLDIGCGAGDTSIAIARRVGATGAVTGVDLSPQLLAVARERSKTARASVEFIEADVSETAFDHAFDAVFSRFGIMFFDAPARAFAHIRSQTRADGRLVFVCWRNSADNDWATIPISAITPILTAPLPPPNPDAPGPYAFADGGKVERILREAGWRDIALTPWDGGLSVAGGGTLDDIAAFLMRIGPCARAIADQGLDADAVRQRLIDRLAPRHKDGAVMLQAACWIVTARA
jgi:SAM-dependent methyltransferase